MEYQQPLLALVGMAAVIVTADDNDGEWDMASSSPDRKAEGWTAGLDD